LLFLAHLFFGLIGYQFIKRHWLAGDDVNLSPDFCAVLCHFRSPFDYYLILFCFSLTIRATMKRIILVVLFALFLCGCSKTPATPQQQIIGIWQESQNNGTLEFTNDGTMRATGKSIIGVTTNELPYSFVDENHIQIKVLGKDLKTLVTVSDDALTLTGDNGETKTFTRVGSSVASATPVPASLTAPPVTTLVAPPVAAPVAPAVPLPNQPHTTQAEEDYMKNVTTILGLLKSADDRLSKNGYSKENIALSLAEAQSAQDYHRRFFGVPARFIEADNYLTQGLSKEKIALTMFQISGVSDDRARDEYVAAGVLIKQALDSFQKELDAMQKGQ